MKRFAYFTLEGLLEQGPHRVWITLGRYASEQLASQAAANETGINPGITDTRILPLYRDDGILPAVQPNGILTPATVDTHDSVTVA